MQIQYFLFLFFFFGEGYLASAQKVAAYFDHKNYFQVFDDGAYKELEYTPVNSYKVGGDFVAYINMDSSLKFYYKGDIYTLEESKPQSFVCSMNFCIYKMNRRLMKVEGGDKTTLCEWATDYQVGDSIIAYRDYGDPSFKIYYNGTIYKPENGTVDGGVKEYKVSQNAVAYLDNNNNLKVWWHGRSYLLSESAQGSDYKVAADMVSFQIGFTNEFKIFYRGEVVVSDPSTPLTVKSNLNSIAYVDRGGNFNIFYEGESVFISAHSPDAFEAFGNIVWYNLNNQVKVFFKGKNYLLENSKLDFSNLNNKDLVWDTKLARNSYPYLDPMGRMKMFDSGELRSNVSYELPIRLHDMNDILVYTVGINTINIYYKGKGY